MTKEKKHLDTLFRKVAKLKYGEKCEVCRITKYLNVHHIYSRSKLTVRWDLDNASVLCSGHHALRSDFSAHKTPLDYIEFMRNKRGDKWYKELQMRANSFYKVDYNLIKLYLLQEAKKYTE